MECQAAKAAQTGVAAVDRAIAILQAVAKGQGPSSLSDLARTTGLYKSTILRLLESLEAAELVVRDDDSQYTLGSSVFGLGLAYERAHPLGKVVLPFLEQLVHAGTESASLHIRHNATTRICLLRVDSRHSTLDRVQAGDILPVDRGAAGRVLAAYDVPLTRAGARIRAECFAVSMGERDPACAGLASPIFGPHGSIRGALSLSGPKERFTTAAIEKMRGLLLNAAMSVTRQLGGEYPATVDPDATRSSSGRQQSKGKAGRPHTLV